MPTFVRYKHGGVVSSGILTQIGQQKIVAEIAGNFYDTWTTNGTYHPLEEIELVCPCTPTKIIGVGVNYYSMAKALDVKIPSAPLFFLKPASGATGPDTSIVIPSMSRQVDYEIELAAVIKKRGKEIPPSEAMNYVLGYTCSNDVTAVDLLESGKPWLLAKGFDTFTPLGPYIVSAINPDRLCMETYLNNTCTQHGSTRDMIVKIPELIAHVSNIMTLEAGDVLLTGTIPGKGTLHAGDQVVISISDIGSMKNTVIRS